IKLYRENFQPSKDLQEPYVLACVNVIAADTDSEAERLSTSIKQLFMGIVTGRRSLLQPPVDNMEDIWNIYEEQAVNQMLTYSFVGGPERLRSEVLSFVEKTGVNEI